MRPAAIATLLVLSLPALADVQVGDTVKGAYFRRLSGDEFYLKHYVGDERSSPSSGQVSVVFSFWATWCVKCAQETPYVLSAMRELAHERVRFFFVSTDPHGVSDDSLRSFIRARGWAMPDSIVLRDVYSSGLRRFAADVAVPRVVLIDTSRVVRLHDEGFSEDEAKTLAARVREALK